MSAGTGVHRDELVPLTDGWAVWPLAALRSAGMAAERILPFGGDGGFRPADDVSAAVDHLLADPRFVEAVTWQNRPMVENWLGDHVRRLAAGDRMPPHRSRRQLAVARYAQRYTTKNDTIGFFGPVAWAQLDPSEGAAVTVAGTGVEVRRGVHFEAWVMESLAARCSGTAELRGHLPPRRDPSSLLVGSMLRRPRRADVRLTDEEAAVLSRCDGRAGPAAILDRLRGERPELGFTAVREVQSILGALALRGCVVWEFQLPLSERMELDLLRQLRAVPDPLPRERPIARLEALIARRDAAAGTAGDPPRLAAALAALEREYRADDPGPPPHAEGRTGRELVWLDTLADWQVTLGGPALATLRMPLCLILDACRWLTYRVAVGIEERAREFVRGTPSGRARFGVLLAELAPELTGAEGGVLDHVVAELHTAIASLLPPEPGARRQHFDARELAGAWSAAFAAPGPGWEAARTHSPDLMLDASTVDGAAGYRWVLGEVHVAVNTLDNRVFVANQRVPGRIERLVRASTAGTRYVPAIPRTWPGIGPRTYPPLTVDVPGRFVYWSLEPRDVLDSALRRMPCAGLEVVVAGSAVSVIGADGFTAPFVEFIGEPLSFLVGNALRLFPPRRHQARVSIDRVVVQRETWHAPAAELVAGLPRERGEETFSRRMAALGAPRFSFVRLPDDPKPIFCDLNSRPLVHNVLRLARRADGAVRIQEMLPGFDGLWLTAADGRRTSEFRMVAVDRRGTGEDR